MREYCCATCGLIWFDDKMRSNDVTCPECESTQSTGDGIYACDTIGWFYANEGVAALLKEQGKSIHYHKDHPWHNKDKQEG